MVRLFCITLCLVTFAGGCHRSPEQKLMDQLKEPRFDVQIENPTDRMLEDVTCTYPGGHAVGGILGPHVSAGTCFTNLPTSGPIVVEWNDSGQKYRAEVPLLSKYIVRPQGTLIIRIRANHTVNVLGVRAIDYDTMPPSAFAEGDSYRAISIPQK